MRYALILLLCAGVASAQTKPKDECPNAIGHICTEGFTCKCVGFDPHVQPVRLRVETESVQLMELIEPGLKMGAYCDKYGCLLEDGSWGWIAILPSQIPQEPPLSDDEIKELREFLSCIHGTQCYALMK